MRWLFLSDLLSGGLGGHSHIYTSMLIPCEPGTFLFFLRQQRYQLKRHHNGQPLIAGPVFQTDLQGLEVFNCLFFNFIR